MTEWFERWFGEEYLALYPHRDEREAAAAVGLVESNLGGIEVKRALDLACGAGRHSRLLSERWWTAGFDLSAALLARAKAADPAGVYVRGDMRALPFVDQGFDLVVNLFTSFGYFQDPADDLKTLKGVARALKPGGLLLLDIINGDYVRRHFTPHPWYDMGDHYHLEEIELNADGAFNAWTNIYKKTGDIRKRSFFSRLYDRRRLAETLKKAGLAPLKFWGGFAGEPLSPHRNRLIALARRPG